MSNSLPSITSLSPSTGPTAGGTLVTIKGSGFNGATAVKFGEAQANPISVSTDEVTVKTPVSSSSGTVNVQVNIPTGLSPVVEAAKFKFIAPSLESISPNSGPITGGTCVTITGSGLTGATAVAFGATQANPSEVTDTQVTATTPAVTQAETVGVQVNLPTGLVPPLPTSAPQFTYSPPGPPVNAQFVVVNQTSVPDELIFVKFLGADINTSATEQTYGDQHALKTGSDTSSTSYSLAEMTSNTGINALPNPIPNFAINDYSGGRIYFSLVKELTSATPPAAQNPSAEDFSTVYGYVEPSVFKNQTDGNTNLDTSYVDFVGLPIDIAIKNSSDGSLAHPPANNPLSTPSGKKLFDALTGDSQIPPQTQVTACGTAKNSNNASVSINGAARILSPSLYDPSLIDGAQAYHGWTDANELIGNLQSNSTNLKVSSYVTTDTGTPVPLGTLFGFAGSKAVSPISSIWIDEQTYDLTATAVADLNPGGANQRIFQLEGKPGIVLTGSGRSVDDFSIYLTNHDLNAPTGVYGANPPYVVDWTGRQEGAKAYSLDGIANDLSGRVVGDLLAGFNFGWASCSTTVSDQANANGTTAHLANSVFDVQSGTLADTEIGNLSTGQFFYLLSLQPNTADVAKWFGASIQPNQPNFYNNYASDFQKLTNCYNMAFTDRLQGPTDPDMFITPSPDIYVEITLLPGAYAVTESHDC